MLEHWNNQDYNVVRENMMPVCIKAFKNARDVDELLNEKPACISFQMLHCAVFEKQGAYVVLDFGKELCGGLRIVTRDVKGMAEFRITLGESLSEACSSVGEKNAGNDHSPRDFQVQIPFMSDLTFGQTGFRFARIELCSDEPVYVRNIFAINTLPYFEREGYITTSDEELNRIIDAAAYTLKLNLQNGYIWDGIKRDRLVWSGDLNQEIITSIYLFGDNRNITNSLSFLREETSEGMWMNEIPSYSSWWVINLCDYCRLTGNMEYFRENQSYAEAILRKFNDCIDDDGNMNLGAGGMAFFLDWPTARTADAVIGTAALIILAAKAYLEMAQTFSVGADEGDVVLRQTTQGQVCHSIIDKLQGYLEQPCEFKQTRAFQILAGRAADGEDTFIEKEGAKGFSTFMSYYILTADALADGKNILPIIKEYFGAMLSRGATTFWEDFHMDWLEGSGRVDELPKEGEKDIHGDYGAFCYKGFRHSLCHGWASGVLAFLIEYMLGLKLTDGGKAYEVNPHPMGIREIHAKIPIKIGWLVVDVVDGKVELKVQEEKEKWQRI